MTTSSCGTASTSTPRSAATTATRQQVRLQEHILSLRNSRRYKSFSWSVFTLCMTSMILLVTLASDVILLRTQQQSQFPSGSTSIWEQSAAARPLSLPTSSYSSPIAAARDTVSQIEHPAITDTRTTKAKRQSTWDTTTVRAPQDLLLPPEDAFAMELPDKITEGMHVSSPPHTGGTCSCWNLSDASTSTISISSSSSTTEVVDEDDPCCDRRVHPNHKFGHVLVTELFAEGSFYHRPGMAKGLLSGNFRKDYFHRKHDYREVFVIRNWFSAIVSGYLYHKSGRECWLDDYGNPLADIRHHRWKLANPDFIHLLRPNPIAPFPDGNGRDLCTYLSEESEYTGLRVFAEYIVRKFYFRSVQIFSAVQQYEDPVHRRTMFLCFEELSSPKTKAQTIQRIMDWLYPGGQYASLPVLPETTTTTTTTTTIAARSDHHQQQQQERLLEYNGGHATSKDPNQLRRLQEMVISIDRNVFNGTIAKYNALFACQKRS